MSRRQSVWLLLLAAAISLIPNPSNAGISVIYPSAVNYLHSLKTGTVKSTLAPDPVQNALEFFLLDSISAEVKAELAGGDTSFAGWTFNYDNFQGSKWKSAKGILNIDIYKAEKPSLAFAGAYLDARYNRASGDPTNLQWIQLVKPLGSYQFDPDQLFNSATGAEVSNGPIPAANGAFIDPYPNDGTDGGPFYWNSSEWPAETNGSNAFGSFDLHFSDHPKVPVNNTFNPNGLQFELYLVQWDGMKTVDFLDGIRWGFFGVPEPNTLVLLGLAVLLLLVVRQRQIGCSQPRSGYTA